MELMIRGYPSRIRFGDWQRADTLPETQLPALSQKQRQRARLLRIPERAYSVALKASEFARDRLPGQLEHVASVVDAAAKKRDVEITALVWNFYEHQFQIVARQNGKEHPYNIPGELVNAVLLGKQGAEQRLKQEVDFWLGGWAE